MTADRPTMTIAVILGASEFPAFKQLSGNPAFGKSAAAFREYLRAADGLGLAQTQVLDLFDSKENSAAQILALDRFLRGNPSATDLIFYYVGHGALRGPAYYLLIHSTDEGVLEATGLSMSAIGPILKRVSKQIRSHVILDCCFAAEAALSLQSATIADGLARKTSAALPQRGCTLLAAASRDDFAFSPPDARYTQFSECLLDVLAKGTRDVGDHMSLRDVAAEVDRLLQDRFDTPARPELHVPQQPDGDVSRFPLFPNPAARAIEQSALSIGRTRDVVKPEPPPLHVDDVTVKLRTNIKLVAIPLACIALTSVILVVVRNGLRKHYPNSTSADAARQDVLVDEGPVSHPDESGSASVSPVKTTTPTPTPQGHVMVPWRGDISPLLRKRALKGHWCLFSTTAVNCFASTAECDVARKSLANNNQGLVYENLRCQQVTALSCYGVDLWDYVFKASETPKRTVRPTGVMATGCYDSPQQCESERQNDTKSPIGDKTPFIGHLRVSTACTDWPLD